MRLVLYEPDIPQNVGTMMRLAACLGIGLDIIEPCGFVLDDRRLRRAVMDYLGILDWRRWQSWTTYRDAEHAGRLILMTTRGACRYTDWSFECDDRVMVGQESAGVPSLVHEAVDARLAIPLRPPARSLNVSVAAGICLYEVLRQRR